MNSREIFAAVLEKLNEKGFIPYGAVKLGKRPNANGLLLHELIREVIGMKFDDSVYMYWEWQELSASLDATWRELDDAASKIASRRTTAIAHVFEESVGKETVKSLFEAALMSSSVIEFPTITRRPTKSEPSVRFVGKMMGALFATIGSIEEARNSGYGDLFSSLTDEVRTNEELLMHLDNLCKSLSPSLDLKPPKSVVIIRALGKAYEETNRQRANDDLESLSLSEFLIETEESANWAGLSDSVVLKRLLAISPEDAEAAKQAIEKFLGE